MGKTESRDDGLGETGLALLLLNVLRRFTFLPTLVCIVPVLVLLQGGDALR
jgi:hypothetical protein|eukprot:COSAG06_NODE_97_length_24284_cov_6.792270_11_plen_51_part_00